MHGALRTVACGVVLLAGTWAPLATAVTAPGTFTESGHCAVGPGTFATFAEACAHAAAAADSCNWTGTPGCSHPNHYTADPVNGVCNVICDCGSICSWTASIGINCPAGSQFFPATNDCQWLPCTAPLVRDTTGSGACVCPPNPSAACDDGKPCTLDTCDDATGCVHTYAASGCQCTVGSTPTAGHTLQKEFTLGSLECPGLGGTMSAKLKLSGTGTTNLPTCGSACNTTSTLTGSAEAELSMCTDRVTVTASGTASASRAYVPECNPDTCSSGCGLGYCGREASSGSVGLAVSRAFTREWSKSALGAQLSLKCGGQLSGSGSVGGGMAETTNVGDPRGTCADCAETSATVSGGLGVGKTGCAFSVGYRGSTREVACKECLSASGTLTGTVTNRTGACGSSSCSSLVSTVKLAAETPKVQSRALWWKVEAKCKAELSACGESRTCGACACGGAACSELKSSFSCSVCAPGSLLCQSIAR